MSFIAKNPSVWAESQPDDGPPPPAPIRLSVSLEPDSERGHGTTPLDWCFSLDTDQQQIGVVYNLNLQCGYRRTREEAIEAGRECARSLGFTEVSCGWSDTGYGYTP